MPAPRLGLATFAEVARFSIPMVIIMGRRDGEGRGGKGRRMRGLNKKERMFVYDEVELET